MAERESPYLWSTTALTNGTVDPSINFAEGQLPGTVNNSNRAAMAAYARHLKDTNGSISTTGSSNAYAITLNTTKTAYATGFIVGFKANHTNTGAATLNVTNADATALGAKAIRSLGDAALTAGQIVQNGHYLCRYDAAANGAAGAFILLNPVSLLASNNLSEVTAATAVANLGLRVQVSVSATLYIGTAPATVTISNGSPGVITWTGHGRSANDTVAFSTSGALPTGLTAGVVYYVKTVQGVDTFTVSATEGGAEINTSSAGSGTHKAWTGDDDGAGTSAAPFMTLQAAWNYGKANYDLRGVFLTLQVRAAHQYSASYVLNANGAMSGQASESHVQITGDTSTPGNCILEGALSSVLVQQGARVLLQGFKIISAGDGLNVTQDGWCSYQYIDFGACSTCHYTATKAGQVFDSGNITISGNAPAHGIIGDTGIGYETTGTTTLSGTPAFSTAYIFCNQGGKFTGHTKTYSGSATGSRFSALNDSIISAQTLTKLPGDAAGTLDDTSLYISGDGADITSLYPAWSTYTPSVTAAGGSITPGTVTGRYKTDKRNRTRRVKIEFTPSANTATGWLNVTLPTGNPVANFVGSGRRALGGAISLIVFGNSGSTTINVTENDNTVPAGTEIIVLDMEYEI